MLFIADHPNNLHTGLETHGLHIRSINQLFIPIENLISVRKGIIYSGIKIYNSLPSNNFNLTNDRKQFKNELCMYLLKKSFYFVKEFLKFSGDNQLY
jgi:hypothetical protein